MAVRISLLFVAAVFLCVGTAFLGAGLYHALALAMPIWAAGLVTGLIALSIGGLFALVGSHWSSRGSGSALGGAGLGAAAAAVSRAVESNPLAAIAAAAVAGILQSMLLGRRR